MSPSAKTGHCGSEKPQFGRVATTAGSTACGVRLRGTRITADFVLVRSSVYVGLQGRIDAAVDWRRDAVAAAELDHFASEPRQLEPVAAEQIIPHGSSVMRRHGAHHRERLVDAVRWQPYPLGEADGDGFAQGRLVEGQ